MSLKRFGYTNLFACDLSDYFGDLYKQVGIPLAVADLENGKLPYEDSTFDVVIFAHVIEHLHSIENAMLEIKRVLKKG
ncbi:MAG: class I SAM-dependent methyltransferase [Patescibacteria group bacterium]